MSIVSLCRACCLAGVFGLLGASSSAVSAAPPLTFDASPYLQPARLVDIGGRRLNLYCTGEGSPTIILEAGLGDDLTTWRYVQPALARRTRVCAYDRAAWVSARVRPRRVMRSR